MAPSFIELCGSGRGACRLCNLTLQPIGPGLDPGMDMPSVQIIRTARELHSKGIVARSAMGMRSDSSRVVMW